MKKVTRFVGLDVHGETIAVAVCEENGEVTSLGQIPNRPEYVAKLMKKLKGSGGHLRVCYEAGPTGYVLYWQLTQMGIECTVVAPTLIPVKSGDRVKTDRRDAAKLARFLRNGDLTAVWVPDAAHEALRDLVRAREAAKKDQVRDKHRLTKFLLRQGRRPPEGTRPWTLAYLKWVRAHVHFEQGAQEATLQDYLHQVEQASERIARLETAIDEAIEKAPKEMKTVIEALQTLRGVAKVAAVTLVAEIGNFSRFTHPEKLMAYCGIVSSEYSTGGTRRQGAITKTGNQHLRRTVVEAAWHYRHRASISGKLQQRQKGQSKEINALSWKAQQRLCGRFHRLETKGKIRQKVVTAVGRELLGFVWSIGMEAERVAG